MELVTGFQGKNHVTAAQIGRLLKGLAGSGNYVLETQNRFAAELLSVNKVSIGTGDLVADGRYFTNEAPEELTIENGAVGLNRNDLVVCRYTKAAPQTDEDGNIDYTVPRIEDGKFAVVKGTPSSGTPEDPEITTAPMQDNNTDLAEFPIWRLPIRGLSVETPEPLFKILQSADAFRDSQSQELESVKKITDNIAFHGSHDGVAFHVLDGQAIIRIWGTNGIYYDFYSDARLG